MHDVQIQLTDQLYDEANRRAVDAGFNTIGEFVTDVLTGELTQDTEDFDYLFTPERIAHLDRVAASVKAGGKTYTTEEVRAHLAATRSDWIRKNGQ